MISMGTAHADTPYIDTYPSPDPYDVLFGASGQQGIDDAALDSQLALTNPTGEASFQIAVDQFEANTDHPLADLINAIDPSAFYEQTGGGAVGTIADTAGAYLVPDDALGYLATGLDYGLLTPTGLSFVLDPLIDILLGASPA
jgi:hypothetical protein